MEENQSKTSRLMQLHGKCRESISGSEKLDFECGKLTGKIPGDAIKVNDYQYADDAGKVDVILPFTSSCEAAMSAFDGGAVSIRRHENGGWVAKVEFFMGWPVGAVVIQETHQSLAMAILMAEIKAESCRIMRDDILDATE
jgi:hypothetical protein